MLVGAHVSMAGGIAQAVDRQVAVGGNCGQLFTHSPQVWDVPSIPREERELFRDKSARLIKGPWVVHSSYLVNLASPDSSLRERSVESLQTDIDIAQSLGVRFVNVHLGAHTGAGTARGLRNAADSIDSLTIPDGVSVLLETDAGSGTKLGGSFAEIDVVLRRSRHDLGVCLDTAHSFAAGYDLRTPRLVDETLAVFDQEIGLGYLSCIHLNDSKHPCGSAKDEHAHIGDGFIGDEGLQAVVTHEELSGLPFILETPTEDGRSFEWNIAHVRTLRG